MAQNWYERHVLPLLIDLACGSAPMREMRRQVVPTASGKVLEVGIGTGRNLPFYDAARVHSLVGVEPSLRMHRLTRKRSHQAGIALQLVGLSAEQLPLADASFDTVVCTFTLCTIPDVTAALAELHRVVRPGGRFHFLEHGRAPDESVRTWQRRIEPIQRRVAGGCHLTRDPEVLVSDAGFEIVEIERRYVKGPKPFAYFTLGKAIRPA